MPGKISKNSEYLNFEDGRRAALEDARAEEKQFFDDLCDGQRDAYLDELEGE